MVMHWLICFFFALCLKCVVFLTEVFQADSAGGPAVARSFSREEGVAGAGILHARAELSTLGWRTQGHKAVVRLGGILEPRLRLVQSQPI
jgi:hypothetical protein